MAFMGNVQPAQAPAQRVKVGVRVRPSAEFAQQNLALCPDDGTVRVRIPHNSRDVVNNKQEEWLFTADWVAANSSQDEVYINLAEDAVRGVLEGKSATILAYGQTGSGKSFTMLGDVRAYRNRGVTPRALSQLMAGIAARPEIEFSVTVSLCELYLDSISDLLAKSSHVANLAAPLVARYRLDIAASTRSRGTNALAGSGQFSSLPAESGLYPSTLRLPGSNLAHDLAIVDDPVEGVSVRGLSQVPVYSEEDALAALFAGEQARVTAQHSLNRRSSRGHSVFTVTVRQRRRLGGGREVVTVSKLALVDLAGSERLKRTAGQRKQVGGAGADPRGLVSSPGATQQGPASAGGSAGSPPLVGLPTTTRPVGSGIGHHQDRSGLGLIAPADELLYKESVSINKSLGYLEQCVAALRHRNPSASGGASAAGSQHYRRASTGSSSGAIGGFATAGAFSSPASSGMLGATTASAFSAAGGGAPSRLRALSSQTLPAGGFATSLPSAFQQPGAASSPQQPPLVPFRQSKLTSLLRDCFGGGTATVFIACICAEANHIDETLTTLRLAQRMARLTARPGAPRQHVDARALAVRQADLIASLTQELALHDAIAGRAGVAYGEYSPEQRAALTERLRAYIAAAGVEVSAVAGGTALGASALAGGGGVSTDGRSSPEFPIESVRQMREALRIARQLVQQAQATAEARVRAEMAAGGSISVTGGQPSELSGTRFGAATASMPAAPAPFMDPLLEAAGVGELDPRAPGFAIGLARDDDAPPDMQVPASFAAARTRRQSLAGPMPPTPGAGATTTSRRGSAAPTAQRRASMPASVALGGTLDGVGGFSAHASAADAETQRHWNRFIDTAGLGADAAAELDDLNEAARSARGALADAARTVRAARLKVDSAQKRLQDAEAVLTAAAMAASQPASAAAGASQPASAASATAASTGARPAGGKADAGKAAAPTAAAAASPKGAAAAAAGKKGAAAAPVTETPQQPSAAPPAAERSPTPPSKSRADFDRARADALQAHAAYTQLHAAYLSSKAAAEGAQHRVARHTAGMLEGFEGWFAGHHGGKLPSYGGAATHLTYGDPIQPAAAATTKLAGTRSWWSQDDVSAAAESSQPCGGGADALDEKEAFDEMEVSYYMPVTALVIVVQLRSSRIAYYQPTLLSRTTSLAPQRQRVIRDDPASVSFFTAMKRVKASFAAARAHVK